MKLNYAKEWFEQRIEKDGAVEVGAGLPAAGRIGEPAAGPKSRLLDTRIVFGQFVALWRRNKGWNAEKLAAEAGVGVEEILEIEHIPDYEPEAHAVFKLADVFGVPSRRLFELAGLVEGRSPRIREEAIRFAARFEPIAALSDEEREALEAFVTTLTTEAGALSGNL